MDEPTRDERRNGWTAEALAKYRREREAAGLARIDPHGERRVRDRRPVRANSRYRPLRWRG